MRVKVNRLDATLKTLAQTAYPNYRGRIFHLAIADRPLNVKSYWDGGSRDYFVFVELATMKTMLVPPQSAFDRQLHGAEAFALPEGFVCVEHSIVCDKDRGLTFHVSPANAPRMLAAANVV